jgi:hypothetical protein
MRPDTLGRIGALAKYILNIESPLPIPAHLRAATLELLRTARYSHPYYWAAFILVGDFE